jgi:hypothetical protein
VDFLTTMLNCPHIPSSTLTNAAPSFPTTLPGQAIERFQPCLDGLFWYPDSEVLDKFVLTNWEGVFLIRLCCLFIEYLLLK